MAKVLKIDGLGFSPTGVGADFEADCGVVLEGRPEGALDDIWFKAYDTSLGENDRDLALSEQGCPFNCVVMFRPEGALYGPDILPSKGARTRAEAESYFEQVYGGLRDGSIEVPLEG